MLYILVTYNWIIPMRSYFLQFGQVGHGESMWLIVHPHLLPHVEQWQPQQLQSPQQQHQQQRRQQQQHQCGSSNISCLWLLVHACGVVVE